MKMNKFNLLAAAAISAVGAGTAQAQYAIPTVEIDGAGASLPANTQRQAFDCYGIKVQLAFSGAASATNPIFLKDFNFPAASTPTPANSFDCAVRIVQPNVTARYISTGSGAGINSYLFHSSPEAYPGSTVVLPAGFSSYVYGVQYANSDNALSYANVFDASAGYNNRVLPAGNDKSGNPIGADTALNRYGPAIQIPVYVAPVVIDYSPVYAKVTDGLGNITSYSFKVAGARSDGSGGLKLTRAQYCGILSGTITNWNQLPATVVTKATADPAAFDVPIVLAGRSESSGTTGILTRALAAQCGGSYVNSTSTLPAAVVSGAVFNKGTTPTFSGSAEVVGKFTVANGNDGVAQLVAYHPDPTGAAGTRTQNGRIGYNGPDFTLPAVTYTEQNTYGLNTASLQVNGTGSTYAAPTAANAVAAFGGIQPPQSKGTSGAYDSTVTATNRANPLDWVYPANKFLIDNSTGAVTTTANPLASPTKGYPIVGTSNVLLYTCYADAPTRQAIDGVWATFMGKTTRDSTGTTTASAIPTALFTDGNKGVLAVGGLAAMPLAWRNAVAETFLKSSAQLGQAGVPASKLGLRNLWIQSAIPTTTAATTANPNCAGKPGA